MLGIFQSSQSVELVEQLSAQLSRSQASVTNPLSTRFILVQSPGMAQWVKLELAKRQGIAANLEFPLPASFLWNVYRAVLGENNVPEPVAFSKPVLQFLLLDILPDLLEQENFRDLQQYVLNQPSALKNWQLAGQLADAFDHYLVYRPDWLADWEAGGDIACESQPWQAVLWRELVKRARSLPDTAQHRAEINRDCIRSLQQGKIVSPEKLPGRLSVFGLSSLPPQYLELFVALGQHLDIDLFQLNPSCHYWGDIRPEKHQARKFLREHLDTPVLKNLEQGHEMIGNPLLASMGKQGREWIDSLLAIPDAQFDEQFVELPEPCSLLSTVQYEMYNLLYAGEIEPCWLGQHLKSPYRFPETDRSIQFHSCYSEQREVEVLYDWLLHRFSDKSLNPGDVIVMIPDISRYAPSIDAVFMRGDEQSIPYTLSDRRMADELPLLDNIVFLLAWHQARKTSQEVFDLLSLPAVARKFGLESQDLEFIHQAINEAGIRWGRGDDRSQWQLPDDISNSWEFGFRRLVLGYAMDEAAGLFQQVLPSAMMQGEGIRVLDILFECLALLDQLELALQQEKSLSQWQQLLLEVINNFYQLDDNESAAFTPLIQALDARIEQAKAAGFEQTMDAVLFVELLSELISAKNDSFRFLDGGVTFCSLMPMRCIPFKAVCLLGMNEADFPRQVNPNVFDLVQDKTNKPRRGDRDSRADDRYQFLEAIMAAGDFLYLSYTGISRRNNEPLPASVLLEELREYVSVLAGKNVLPVQHSLQPFDPVNYQADEHGETSFEKLWFSGDTQRAAIEWLNVDEGENQSWFELPESLSLAELKRFYENPQRAWFAQAGVDYSLYHSNLPVEETFKSDSLLDWEHNQQAFAALRDSLPYEQWHQQMIASGRGVTGLLEVSQSHATWQRASMFYQDVKDVLAEPQQVASLSLEFELQGKPLVLKAELPYFSTGSLTSSRSVFFQRDTIKLLFSCWLEHLMFNAAGYKHHTELYCYKKETIHYRIEAVPASQAMMCLQELLQHFIDGHQQPSWLVMPFAYEYALCQQSWQEENPGQQDEIAGLAEMQKAVSDCWGGYEIDSNDYLQALLPYASDYQYVLQETGFLDLTRRLMMPLLEHCQLQELQQDSLQTEGGDEAV